MNLLNFFQKKEQNEQKQPTQRPRYHYSEAPKLLGQELAKRERVDLNLILGYLPDPDEILYNTGKDVSAYRKLMVDSQVRACINSRKAGTLSLNWEIDRGKTRSKQAKLIQDLYNDLDIDAVNHAILNAPLFGFQPIEVIWDRVGDYILPVGLVPKNQEWFLFDKDGNLTLSAIGNCMGGEELPDRKFSKEHCT